MFLMFFRLNSIAHMLTSFVIGLAGNILLFGALFAAIAKLTGAEQAAFINPLSWGALLPWSWDTVWKAAVIGLLCSIACTHRRSLAVQMLIQIELHSIRLYLSKLSMTRRRLNLNNAPFPHMRRSPSMLEQSLAQRPSQAGFTQTRQ